MITAKSMEVRDNFKSWCCQVTEGEVVRIIRPGNSFVYLIGQKTYEKLKTERRLEAYTSYVYGKDKIINLKRLAEISALPEDWNNNGAGRIPESLIRFVRRLIVGIERQPEIFPTAADAIQLEWENDRGEYLEMELLDDSVNVFCIDRVGDETQYPIELNAEMIKDIVRGFYERTV